MTTTAEVGAILSEMDPRDRTAYFSALLAREAGLEGDDFVVVGRSAIRIYTRGDYASGDIDLTGDRERLVPVLRSWGFRKGGRLWIRDDWKVVVDLVRDRYSGDISRTQTVSTPYGDIRIAAIEDVLAKRLISTKHWKRPTHFEEAVLLASRYVDTIDWGYVRDLTRRDQSEDILDELLRRLRRRTKTGTSVRTRTSARSKRASFRPRF